MPSSVQQATPMTLPPTVAPMIVPMNAPSPFSRKSRVTPRPSAVLLSDTSLPTSPLKTVFKPFGSKSRIGGGIVSEIDVHLADIEPGKLSKPISAKSAFTALHKALIVGVVYTSIVASECSYITGRTKRILDDEFRSRDKESPMTTMVFLFFMFPMSTVTIVIFWAYIYRLYLRQIDKQLDQEYNLAMRDIFLKKRKAMGAVTKPEMIAVVIFVAFVLTFALNAIGQLGITYTMTTYVLVVLVIGVPREFGNPFLADMSVTWPLIMAYMPWDMIIMRIGGMELAHFSRMSGVSTWIIDKVLVGNLRMMSPFWSQLVLLATTAVLAELDTSFGFGSRVVPDMLQLADELRQNELYLALPVVMQSSYVLLMPYTRISLIFIHQYTDIEYTELVSGNMDRRYKLASIYGRSRTY
nr:solute carrier family 13 member 4-like [Dermacentor andersoni]